MNTKKELARIFAAKIATEELNDEQVTALANALYPNENEDVRRANMESSMAMAKEFQQWQRQQETPPMSDQELEDLAAMF